MSFFSKKQTQEPQNIDEILARFKSLKEEYKQVKMEMETLKKDSVANVNKIGMVRFNPFEGFGGNQSFSLAILDGNDNGAVVTSLFSREANRVYGKPIKQGTSEFKLTEEEKKAIEIAQNKSKLKDQNEK